MSDLIERLRSFSRDINFGGTAFDAEIEITRLQREIAELRAALEFYAEPANWIDTPPWGGDPECITPKAIPVIHGGDDGSPCDCGDTARKALSAQPQPAQADGWRPIETAPKDRTRIILAWTLPESLPPHVELGYWSESKASWVNTYGNAFSGVPNLWFSPPPLPAAPTPAPAEGR